MLLVFPPLAKACEPPPGLALLAGTLRGSGHACTLFDANLEGQLYLLSLPGHAKDTWSRRALDNRERNLSALRRPDLYASPARYQRAVRDLNRVIERAGRPAQAAISLANYQDRWQPTDSGDLWAAAAHWRENPFAPWFGPRLAELCERGGTSRIGFSLNYLSQAPTTFAMIGMVRERFPGCTVILGGGLVTSWMRRPDWHNPFAGLVDHLVEGPGGTALLRLLGGSAAEGLPDYDDFPLDDYLAPGLILPYAASRGCYWRRCRFCPETSESGAFTMKAPDAAMEELDLLCRRYRPALLHLLDNTVSPSLLERLAGQPPGAPWYGFARMEGPLLDPAFCRSLAAGGCRMLKLGLESGDQGVLDAMGKGIRLDHASRVLANLAAAGVATYVYLLFGTPSENLEAARRTLDFTVRHRHAITFCNLAIFNLPAGSPEERHLALTDLYEGDLSLYRDFQHPGDWNRRAVRTFLDREFRSHPAIKAILQRDPPLFTSNHAPLLAPPPGGRGFAGPAPTGAQCSR